MNMWSKKELKIRNGSRLFRMFWMYHLSTYFLHTARVLTSVAAHREALLRACDVFQRPIKVAVCWYCAKRWQTGEQTHEGPSNVRTGAKTTPISAARPQEVSVRTAVRISTYRVYLRYICWVTGWYPYFIPMVFIFGPHSSFLSKTPICCELPFHIFINCDPGDPTKVSPLGSVVMLWQRRETLQDQA